MSYTVRTMLSRKTGRTVGYDIGEGAWTVAHVPGDTPEAERIATLMAAAPDLLQTLKDCLEELQNVDGADWVLRKEVEEAIAKATL